MNLQSMMGEISNPLGEFARACPDPSSSFMSFEHVGMLHMTKKLMLCTPDLRVPSKKYLTTHLNAQNDLVQASVRLQPNECILCKKKSTSRFCIPGAANKTYLLNVCCDTHLIWQYKHHQIQNLFYNARFTRYFENQY